jgi:nitrogen regulatory protein PII
MKRVEIIANNSVEENILEALAAAGVAKYHTKLNNVHGVGSKGPRQGDAVWPEENFILIIYCDDADAATIETAIAPVKQKFPDEGIKVFAV